MTGRLHCRVIAFFHPARIVATQFDAQAPRHGPGLLVSDPGCIFKKRVITHADGEIFERFKLDLSRPTCDMHNQDQSQDLRRISEYRVEFYHTAHKE